MLLAASAARLLNDAASASSFASTPPEEPLWQALRGGALGVAFKRRVALGDRYIADFFAPSVRLVVEVTVVYIAAVAWPTAVERKSFAGSAIAWCA